MSQTPPDPRDQAIKELQDSHKELEQRFDSYVEDRRKEEVKRLRTALIIAAGVVSALATFVWSEILWPAVQAVRSIAR